MDMNLSNIQYLDGQNQLLQKNHRPLWSRIQQTICCWSSESDEDFVDEDTQNLETRKTLRETMNLKQKQIKNELQIIGIHLNICLAKLTQKNFFVDLQQLKAKLKIRKISKLKSNLIFDADQFLVNKGTIFFSLFNDGIMMRQGEMDWAIPEKVLKYLVERTKIINQAYILDAFSNSGSVAIQLAQASNTAFVISLSDNDEDLSNSTINRNIYDSVHKLDFIKGSFERIRLKIKPDFVFLYPPQKWDLLVGLKKALSLCSNIILVLSSQINVNYVGEVLAQLKVFKVEVQVIQVDGNIRYYVVFIGDVAMLDMQDEYQFLCFYLMSDTNSQGLYDRLYQLLKIVSQKMNFDEILSLAKECRIETESSSETIVQRFIHRMMEIRVDLREKIMEIFQNIDLDLLLQDTPQINNREISSMTFNPNNDSSSTYTQQTQKEKFRQQNKLETPSFQVNE